jgi:hypothetical protein
MFAADSLATDSLSAHELSPHRPVERIQAPAPDTFLRDYVRASRPVIITGLMDRERMAAYFALEALAERFGDAVVRAAPTRTGDFAYSPKDGIRYAELPLREILRAFNGPGASPYYLQTILEFKLPQLLREIPEPLYCQGARWRRSEMFVAAAGQNAPLHNDLPEVLLAGFRGRKRLVLIPRAQTACVYPYPWYSAVSNFSRVNAFAPDYRKFPRFRDVTRYECVLEEGEYLYIPRLWWHYIEPLETCVGISFRWLNGPLGMLAKVVEKVAPMP